MSKKENNKELWNGTKKWYLKAKHFWHDVLNYKGNKIWLLKGLRHRLDGPALIYSDSHKKWYGIGKKHRLDGPAIEYTEEEFNKLDVVIDSIS